MLGRITAVALVATIWILSCTQFTSESAASTDDCNGTVWERESVCPPNGKHWTTTICCGSFSFNDCSDTNPVPSVILHAPGWAVIEGDAHEKIIVGTIDSESSGSSSHDPVARAAGERPVAERPGAAATAPAGGDDQRAYRSRILFVRLADKIDVVFSVRPQGSTSYGVRLRSKSGGDWKETPHGKALGLNDGQFFNPEVDLPLLEHKPDPKEIEAYVVRLHGELAKKK
jgi:hypothetical protein